MIEILELVARGGGGGSGGGGGGGGGGGSGGSSGGDGIGILIIALVFFGYFIAYKPSKNIQKKYEDKVFIYTGIYTALLTVLFLLPIIIFTEPGFLFFSIPVIIGVWLGWYEINYGLFTRFAKKIKETRLKMKKAKESDVTWDESTLRTIASNAFLRFQEDWSKLDTSKLNEYLHPSYVPKAMLMMRALYDLGRLNKMSHVEIHSAEFTNILDTDNKETDAFEIAITASAKDELIDFKDNKVLFTDTSHFTEVWHFEREGDTWKMYDIDQMTANASSLIIDLRTFAKEHNMYFSLDMGWLFLPRKGALANIGGFGNSDINNHVIGNWGDNLVQIYTYTGGVKNTRTTYLVGQLNIPKSYEQILVTPDAPLISFGNKVKLHKPKNTKKYEFEWPDFNKKFDVYASDADKLASFELINPGFMAFMYDIDEDIALEVVDNIIYFIAPSSLQKAKYEKMLELLAKAHKELKL